jgi:predicted DNA-binding ribbon-helix-helix protein
VEHTTVAAIVAAIDKGRGASGLSSAVRVWVLDFFRNPRTDSSADTETGQRTTLG